jgi:hypothetical protein
MAYLAKEFIGIIFVCLLALSIMFTVLACIMMTRRIVFPRVLVLSEDAFLFPRGFPRTRIIRVHYTDIVRVRERSLGGQDSFCMFTGKGTFEIGTSHLPNFSDYNAVRDFIGAKVSAAVFPCVARGVSESKIWREFPDPILRWREPDDWPRYRTLLFTSKPLFSRLARAFWFCIRCFGIFIIPWFILLVCRVPTSPAAEYVSLALACTLFFTLLHWLLAAHPVHVTEISFRDNGLTQLFAKQTTDQNYDAFSGWEIIDRQYEGHTLPILLLRWRHGVRALALPDTNIRGRLVQILNDKKIPHIPKLRPSWDEK